jgi:predicted ester cyclase
MDSENYFAGVHVLMAHTAGGDRLMKSNVEIIQDVIEQVVNQKKIEAWDQYFSQDYIARGAPFIGMGFSVDSSENKHIINFIAAGSPVEGKLKVGDELLWQEDEHKHWATYEEIKRGLGRYRGKKLKVGVQRGDQILQYEFTRDIINGFDTHNDQAKTDMREFMTKEFPDLQASIKQIIADGDRVVCMLEYRGTHADFEREAVWREAWFVRLSDGKIVEGWPILDLESYFTQLGYQIIPPST